MTSRTPESQAEAKITKELFNGAIASTGCLNVMLGKFDLTKTLRIATWTARFIRNSRLKKQERMMGLLTTDEIKNQHLFWTKLPQEIQSDDVTNDRERLGLEENDRECSYVEVVCRYITRYTCLTSTPTQ